MRTRPLIITLLAIAAVGIVTIIGATKTASTSASSRLAVIPSKSNVGDSPDTIDGAKNPDLIPDRVAYALLFRLLANRSNEPEHKKMRSYIGEKLRFGKTTCDKCPPTEGTGEADTAALLAAADKYFDQVRVLDREAFDLKMRNPSDRSSEVTSHLAELQRGKDEITDAIIASLDKQLTSDGAKKLKFHIRENVKKNVKLRNQKP